VLGLTTGISRSGPTQGQFFPMVHGPDLRLPFTGYTAIRAVFLIYQSKGCPAPGIFGPLPGLVGMETPLQVIGDPGIETPILTTQ